MSLLPLTRRRSSSSVTQFTPSVCPLRVCTAANTPSSPAAHTSRVLRPTCGEHRSQLYSSASSGSTFLTLVCVK